MCIRDSNRASLNEFLHAQSWLRKKITLAHPGNKKDQKNPKVVAAQSATKCLPHRNRKTWRKQILRQTLSPLWGRMERRNQHRGKKIRFHQAHTITPQLII